MRVILILISCIISSFGQQKLEKVFSPDNATIPKNIIQKRIITEYLDGGAFRCGHSRANECDYEKLRNVIWQCWSKKTLCYLTISAFGIDSGRVEHIFIEPNKKNQWLVVRRAENWHALRQYRKPLHNLPLVYSVVWKEKDDEKVLLLKNRIGKVIDEY